jgi:hypothetical protein
LITGFEELNKMPTEEQVEKSWEFLTTITEQVEALPEEEQKKIKAAGTGLIECSYAHDDEPAHTPAMGQAKKDAELAKSKSAAAAAA